MWHCLLKTPLILWFIQWFSLRSLWECSLKACIGANFELSIYNYCICKILVSFLSSGSNPFPFSITIARVQKDLGAGNGKSIGGVEKVAVGSGGGEENTVPATGRSKKCWRKWGCPLLGWETKPNHVVRAETDLY